MARRAAVIGFVLSLAFLVAVVESTQAARISRHAAKVRAFGALLALTEQRADAGDFTRASITVGRCRVHGGGWLCDGSLAPVLISGIPVACDYGVAVYRSRTKVSGGDC